MRQITPKDPLPRAEGWVKYLATPNGDQQLISAPPRTRTVSAGTAPVFQTDTAIFTVILEAESLRIKVTTSDPPTSDFFTDWPGSTQNALPAVIAYVSKDQIFWGFEAVKASVVSERVEDLKGLIESKALQTAGGRKPSQVIGNFLDCALKYISAVRGFKEALQIYFRSPYSPG